MPVASAWGVGTPYSDTRPLKLLPGQSTDFNLILQNMNDDDMTVLVSVGAEGNVARLDGKTEYSLPKGSNDVSVKVHVSVPADAKVGTRYKITASVSQKSSGSAGAPISLKAAYSVVIPVDVISLTPEGPKPPVVDSPKSSFSAGTTVTVLAIVALLILVGVMVFYERKTEQPRKGAKRRKQ